MEVQKRMQVLENGDIIDCKSLPNTARNTLYKTELCKHFMEYGSCRYTMKCQFAHGYEELRGVLRHPKYKTTLCKAFSSSGKCQYGNRCRFIHDRNDETITTTSSNPNKHISVDPLESSTPLLSTASSEYKDVFALPSVLNSSVSNFEFSNTSFPKFTNDVIKPTFEFSSSTSFASTDRGSINDFDLHFLRDSIDFGSPITNASAPILSSTDSTFDFDDKFSLNDSTELDSPLELENKQNSSTDDALSTMSRLSIFQHICSKDFDHDE